LETSLPIYEVMARILGDVPVAERTSDAIEQTKYRNDEVKVVPISMVSSRK
jgi:hypothetical protein